MDKAKDTNDCLVVENYSIDGASKSGEETCVILSTLKLAFDIGKCPEKAVSQDFIFISHGHSDHIGGLPMYVAIRNERKMKTPTIIVPTVIKERVEKMFEAHMALNQSQLEYTLIGLDIGEEFDLRDHGEPKPKEYFKAKAFKTYHRVPSQGYVIYKVKRKGKPEYVDLPEKEIAKLRYSGVETEYDAASPEPEVAFTGDTTAEFIEDKDNVDVLKAKILIMESTYIDKTKTAEDAREYGHTHMSEIIDYADRFENKAILLIHFSPRYNLDDIEKAISALPPSLAERVFALKKGFNYSEEQDSSLQNTGSSLSGKTNLVIENYQFDGVSKAGRETCVILRTLNLAFDIGKCPEEAVSQDFIFISHGHSDHIGGLPIYVALRGKQKKKDPPTIIVPTVIKELVEKMFEAHSAIYQSELKYTLIGLDIGEEFYLRGDPKASKYLKAKAFKTYHGVPSQGYVIYERKPKLKPEYDGLPTKEIAKLKLSGVEIDYLVESPEVAFTGDTTADFIVDKDNVDVLKAKILIMESTYIDKTKTVEDARNYGHTHLSEIIDYADRFENKAILLIHFSPRYNLDDIEKAISALPPSLAERVFALKKGFNYSEEQDLSGKSEFIDSRGADNSPSEDVDAGAKDLDIHNKAIKEEARKLVTESMVGSSSKSDLDNNIPASKSQ